MPFCCQDRLKVYSEYAMISLACQLKEGLQCKKILGKRKRHPNPQENNQRIPAQQLLIILLRTAWYTAMTGKQPAKQTRKHALHAGSPAIARDAPP